MAFSIGRRVFKGDTGELLSTEKSPAAAARKVSRLHRVNKPKPSRRGRRARSMFVTKNAARSRDLPRKKG